MKRMTPSLLTRRSVAQAGLLAGAGIALAPLLRAGEALGSNGAPITKRIPATGEKLPVIGIGTNQFKNEAYPDLSALLARMAELGGSVIDSAAMYGGGESEVVIGRALKERALRSKMFVATKFNAAGVGFGPPDPVSGLASFERSLQRLQTDHVDLLMAHALASVEPLMPVMLDLKKQGKIRYLGITDIMPEQHGQLIEYMNKYPIDFVQVDYSLGDRAAAADVFPVAIARKIAIMVAIPLGGGRNSLISAASNRKLPDWAGDIGAATWAQFFLKYVVSHPAVTCAIPGSTSLVHLEDNQQAGRGRLPDAAMRQKMEAFWDSNS